METAEETGKYLHITELKGLSGIKRYHIIREVDAYFVLLFNQRGLKVSLVDYKTLIAMVRDEKNEFYFDVDDKKIVEGIKDLSFNYEEDDKIHEFEIDFENGEIYELDSTEEN